LGFIKKTSVPTISDFRFFHVDIKYKMFADNQTSPLKIKALVPILFVVDRVKYK